MNITEIITETIGTVNKLSQKRGYTRYIKKTLLKRCPCFYCINSIQDWGIFIISTLGVRALGHSVNISFLRHPRWGNAIKLRDFII